MSWCGWHHAWSLPPDASRGARRPSPRVPRPNMEHKCIPYRMHFKLNIEQLYCTLFDYGNLSTCGQNRVTWLSDSLCVWTQGRSGDHAAQADFQALCSNQPHVGVRQICARIFVASHLTQGLGDQPTMRDRSQYQVGRIVWVCPRMRVS